MKLTRKRFQEVADFSMLRFTEEDTGEYLKDLDLIIDFSQKYSQIKNQEMESPVNNSLKIEERPHAEAICIEKTANKNLQNTFFRMPKIQGTNQ